MGVTVTFIVHDPPTAIVDGKGGPDPLGVPQLLVSAKFEWFVPEIPMLEIVRGAVPVFDNVTGIAALVVPSCCGGNVKDPVERLAFGARPVPVSGTVCGGMEPTNVIVRMALAGPAIVGAKDTFDVQLPFFAASFLLTQAWTENGVEAVTLMLCIVTDVVPVLVTVSFCDVDFPTS